MSVTDRTDTLWQRAAKNWLHAKAAHDKATAKLAKARSKILDLVGDSSAIGSGVCVARYFKAGSVDFASIPELRAVDLDQFRKSGRWEFRVTEYEKT